MIFRIDRVTRTNDGNEVRNVVVADKTGKVNFSVWGELGAALNEADILRINKAYTKIWKNQLTLYNRLELFLYVFLLSINTVIITVSDSRYSKLPNFVF